MIPVHLLTGFLGSGKTTLLASLLRHASMGRTAVIVNEFGEVGIDHDLLATGDERYIQLSNGCLCCQLRSGLSETLLELLNRDAGHGVGEAHIDRIVIETSGLADPGPAIHVLLMDPALRGRFRVGEIVTTVDAVIGDATLGRYIEAARQLAVADRIVITKVDRDDARPADVELVVRSARPDVPILHSALGALDPDALFHDEEPGSTMSGWLPMSQAVNFRPFSSSVQHTPGIGSVVIVRDDDVHAATLPIFMGALAENLGQDLVRIKGIVGIVENPGYPAVIQGVEHVYDAPRWLDGWPSADRRTRIVCIGRGLNAAWIRELLDLLDDEVAEQSVRLVRSPA